MSFILQIFSLLASCPRAQCGQFDSFFFSALVVCFLYDDFLVASSKIRTSINFVSVEPPRINSKIPLRFLTYGSPYNFCTSSETFFRLYDFLWYASYSRPHSSPHISLSTSVNTLEIQSITLLKYFFNSLIFLSLR